MPIVYTIDREKNLIHETWTGEVHASDLAAYWKHYLANPEVMAIRRTVVDIRDCTICFPGTDFDGLIQSLVLPILKDRKWTTAIVVARPAQFGTARQYQVFAERYSHDSIFGSIEEAEQWIEKAG